MKLSNSIFVCVTLWACVLFVVSIHSSAAQLSTLRPSFRSKETAFEGEAPTKIPTSNSTEIVSFGPWPPTTGTDKDGEHDESANENNKKDVNVWIEAIAGSVAVVVLVLVVGSVIKRGRDEKNKPPLVISSGHHHRNEKQYFTKRQRPHEEEVDNSAMDSVELASGSSTNWSESPPPLSNTIDAFNNMYMLSDDRPFAPDHVRLDVTFPGDSHKDKQNMSNSPTLSVPYADVGELIGPLNLVFTTEFYPLYLRNERSHLRCFPVCREFNEGPSLDEKVPARMHEVLKRGLCADAVYARVTALKTHVASELVLLGRVSSSKLPTDLLLNDSCTYRRIEDLEYNSHYMRGVVTVDDMASAECVGEDHCTFVVSFKPHGPWTFKGRLSKKHPLYFEVCVLGPASFTHRAVPFDSLGNGSEARVLDTDVIGSILGYNESDNEVAKFADDLGDLFGEGLDQQDIVLLDGYLGTPSAHEDPGISGPHQRNQERLVFGESLMADNLSLRSRSFSGTREKQELVVLGSTRSINFQCATTKSRRVIDKLTEKS